MPLMPWLPQYDLGCAPMDHTHKEFVEWINRLAEIADDQFLDGFDQFLAHTVDHFEQEDRWMEATKYASGNCHSVQHKVVLQVMREGTARAEQGDLKVLRVMASELALWFPQHAQSMDASLALHLRRVGFDPATGVVHAPTALPEALIHGCGGATCSDSGAPGSDEPATQRDAAPAVAA